MAERRGSGRQRRGQPHDARPVISAPRARQRSGQRRSRGIGERLAWRFDRRSPYTQFTAIAAAFSLLLALALVVAGVHWYIAWVLGWSVVTFFFYGFDKRRSKLGRPEDRVPEDVLHALAFLGGFPGGWLGRAYWRHKTLHRSFLISLVLSTVLHILFAMWLFQDRIR
jgi:uncharacterized membrane protein YsdA (DUF1294 family)